MIDLKKLRTIDDARVVVLGNHAGIIQSILDFDYLTGKSEPSIKLVIGVQSKHVRYFWGKNALRIPALSDISQLKDNEQRFDFFISADSGRRVLYNLQQLFVVIDTIKAGVVFAEGVPERHALTIQQLCHEKGIITFGPASVGFIIPGIVKLGAIGGTQPNQIADSKLDHAGSVAVISTSGGMTNEIISLVVKGGAGMSFAAAVGGERFPIQKPVELVQAALDDPQTKTIVFFGEVGGIDEYEVANLVKTHKNAKKKQCIAYIAGVSAESFETAPQFGHAKALAGSASETASAKQAVLEEAGFLVARTFGDFVEAVHAIEDTPALVRDDNRLNDYKGLSGRKLPLFSSSVSRDQGGSVSILGEDLTSFISDKSLTQIALAMFLGRQPRSKELGDFFDMAVRVLVDHGPQVSGVVATAMAARAGKDLPSALSAGLLMIGPKFGGAINQAARNWLQAVQDDVEPVTFVENFAKNKQYISGIGHKKYRADNPDPRVALLLDSFSKEVSDATRLALAVEAITTRKKAQLILNVDGVVAALLIDLLHNQEGCTYEDIAALIDMEFFNAIFIYARTTGFMAHYLDQKRLGDDLFRLPDDVISFEN